MNNIPEIPNPFVELGKTLSAEHRHEVEKTRLYQIYTEERTRIGKLAKQHIQDGGTLDDPEVEEEFETLRFLSVGLQSLVEQLKGSD